VVGGINAGCGRCARCAEGLERHCADRTVLGILGRPGAFAERLALPARNLHPVPDGLATEHAVFVEPLAAAFEIAEQLDLRPGARALVVGDGRLGLLSAQVLRLRGLAVELAGRHPERGAWFDLAHRGPLRPGDLERWPLVVDATGDPRALQDVLARVEPRGTLVLKTTSELSASIDLAPLVVDEVRLQGSRCGPFAPALAALARGEVGVEPLLAARVPLADGARAFELASRPATLKVVIDVATP
jgi:threonine dehydrogenase-like Zn-dependent dehydrogenase